MKTGITPENHQPHHDLEQQVIHTLLENGFLVDSATYHDHMKPETVNRLQMVNTLAGHTVRTRADRIAVHRVHDVVFEIECKTGSGEYPQWAIEAVPLARHLMTARYMGMPCLYCYRHHDGTDAGFWASTPPPFRTLFIPPESRRLHAHLARFFPPGPNDKVWPVENHMTDWVSGGRDAFVTVRETEWRAMDDWPTMIEQAVELLVARNEGVMGNGW